MSRYELARMPRITGGAGSREAVGALTAGLVGARSHVLLVADPGLLATGLADDVAASLTQAGLGVVDVLGLCRRPRRERRRHRRDAGARDAGQGRRVARRRLGARPRQGGRRHRYGGGAGGALRAVQEPAARQAPRLDRHPDDVRHRVRADADRDPQQGRQGQGLALGRRDQGRRGDPRPRDERVAAALPDGRDRASTPSSTRSRPRRTRTQPSPTTSSRTRRSGSSR